MNVVVEVVCLRSEVEEEVSETSAEVEVVCEMKAVVEGVYEMKVSAGAVCGRMVLVVEGVCAKKV